MSIFYLIFSDELGCKSNVLVMSLADAKIVLPACHIHEPKIVMDAKQLQVYATQIERTRQIYDDKG